MTVMMNMSSEITDLYVYSPINMVVQRNKKTQTRKLN